MEEERPFLLPDRAMMEKVYETSKPEAGLFRYIHDKGKLSGLWQRRSIKYFPLGEDKFKEMIYQIGQGQGFHIPGVFYRGTGAYVEHYPRTSWSERPEKV